MNGFFLRTIPGPSWLFLLLPVLFLLPVAVEAQTFRGTVTSAVDGSPIRQAAIQVRSAEEPDRVVGTTTTDSDGEFTVWVRNPGSYTVRVQVLGFQPAETDVLELGPDEVKRIQVPMSVDVFDVEGIEVTGQRREPIFMRGVRERQQSGFGTVYTREDLEFRSGSAVQDILRTQPGMRIIRQIGDGQVGIQTGRAPPGVSRACYATVYVDGVQVFDASSPQPADNVLQVLDLRADEIEAMEVYRGAAQVPAEFSGLGSDCGVIAVWTRTGFERIPPSREDLAYRVRLALGGQTGSPSGNLAPRAGGGIGASAHVSFRDQLSLGFIANFALHDFSAEAIADVAEVVTFAGSLNEGSVHVLSGGFEPRFEFLPNSRVNPVVQTRLLLARRSIRLGNETNPDLGSFSSLGWGIGAGAGVEFRLTEVLGLEAMVGVDRFSFGPYRDLRTETEATWSNVGAQIRLSYSVSPLAEGF